MEKLFFPRPILCVAAVALVSSGCLNDAAREGQTQNGGTTGSGGAMIAGGGAAANNPGTLAGGSVGVAGSVPIGGSGGVAGSATLGGSTIGNGGSGLTAGTYGFTQAGKGGAAAGTAGNGGIAVAGSGPVVGSGGVAGAVCRLAPPCPAGWLQYTDTLCPYPGGSTTPVSCHSNGDGLCYQRCTTNADCTDANFPKCESINMFYGSDYGRSVGVCKSVQIVPRCG